MVHENKVYFLLLLTSFSNLGIASEGVSFVNNTVTKIRKKRESEPYNRFLIFPQGSNVQLIYCMTIGTYAKPEGFFTMGVTAGLAWQLPHKETVSHRKPAEVYHRRSRRELYHKIELMLKTRGKDGRACVLKSLCKAGQRDKSQIGKGTFMEEIMHSLFTLPTGSYHEDPETLYEKAHVTTGDCEELYSTCPETKI